MRGVLMIAISLLATILLASASDKPHKDYVPDQKTAERVADAVLIAQYGEDRVKAGRPLLVDGSNKEYWIVEVFGKDNEKGGGPAVWINRHLGCLRVMDYMK